MKERTRPPRRLTPVLALLVLAPFIGEYLLGNIPARSLYLLPFLIPLYGAGAVLVREAARRIGGGWATIFCFGLAYGTVQAGLVEMSLFNPGFGGHDFTALRIGAWGFSPYYALVFIGGHAIWSISLPIALVETIVGEDRRRPWLGPIGLSFVVTLFLFGLRNYYSEFQTTENFLASPWQLLGAAAAAVVFVICGAVWRSPRLPQSTRTAPAVWLVGLVAFTLSSVFFFAAPETWLGVGLKLAALGGAIWLARGNAGRPVWGPRHVWAVAAGTTATYMWGSLILGAMLGNTTPFDLVATAGVIAAAAGVLAIAYHRSGRSNPAKPGNACAIAR